MPLLDHFHPPLNLRRHWHSFHTAWATYIASALNRLFPEGYFAEGNVQFGIEIDGAAFEETNGQIPPSLPEGWTAPSPVVTVPFAVITDVPTMPFWLRGGLSFPIDLEESYMRTCQEQRVTASGR